MKQMIKFAISVSILLCFYECFHVFIAFIRSEFSYSFFSKNAPNCHVLVGITRSPLLGTLYEQCSFDKLLETCITTCLTPSTDDKN